MTRLARDQNNYPVRSSDKPARSGDKPARSGDKPARSGDKSARSGDKSAQSDKVGDGGQQRERTLLVALLLSSWGPFTTGWAVILSRSTTQLADFIRRTVDLVALFMSWWLFRYMRRRPELAAARRQQLEKRAARAVAGALLITSAVMVVLFFSRLSDFTPGGNVWLGLGIALLGAGVNGWFWARYNRFLKERHDAIVLNQVYLYRAKTLVDILVVAVLAAVAWQPDHGLTRILDLAGSLVVGGYLAFSGIRTLKEPHRSPGDEYGNEHESGLR